MTDLGQLYYEEKRYFFDRFQVHQIVINPQVQGYPPAFLICRELQAGKPCEYAVGINMLQLNEILMQKVSNSERLEIACRLAEALQGMYAGETISLVDVIGRPLYLGGMQATATLKCFAPESQPLEQPLYYFHLS